MAVVCGMERADNGRQVNEMVKITVCASNAKIKVTERMPEQTRVNEEAREEGKRCVTGCE
jgi:hypothetical protein